MSCRHYSVKLDQKDRHYVESDEHNNCVLCLVNEKGAMTQDQVSQYLGLSKMRISQIEKRALDKMKKRGRFIN